MEKQDKVLVELTYAGEDAQGAIFYNENTNRIIPIENPAVHDPTIIIEVSGGVVQAVYASKPELVKVILVDWDNIESAEEGERVRGNGEYSVDPLASMPDETKDQVEFYL